MGSTESNIGGKICDLGMWEVSRKVGGWWRFKPRCLPPTATLLTGAFSSTSSTSGLGNSPCSHNLCTTSVFSTLFVLVALKVLFIEVFFIFMEWEVYGIKSWCDFWSQKLATETNLLSCLLVHFFLPYVSHSWRKHIARESEETRLKEIISREFIS